MFSCRWNAELHIPNYIHIFHCVGGHDYFSFSKGRTHFEASWERAKSNASGFPCIIRVGDSAAGCEPCIYSQLNKHFFEDLWWARHWARNSAFGMKWCDSCPCRVYFWPLWTNKSIITEQVNPTTESCPVLPQEPRGEACTPDQLGRASQGGA